LVVPVSKTQTAIDSSVTIQTLQETQTFTDVELSTNILSSLAIQTETATITEDQTATETITSLQIETSLAIVPTISTSVETSIITLVRSGTTFTAESIRTSYVTVSLTETPAPAVPSSPPSGSVIVPASNPPSGSGSIPVTSEESSCSSYGPSITLDASVCGGEECRVEYELGSFIKWQQAPEKPPVVTEIVFVGASIILNGKSEKHC
jgi:hypothetical protein